MKNNRAERLARDMEPEHLDGTGTTAPLTSGFTVRVFIIFLLVSTYIAFAMPLGRFYSLRPSPSLSAALNSQAIFVIFVMLVTNWLIKKVKVWRAFTRAEIVTTYSMLSISAMSTYIGAIWVHTSMQFPRYKWMLNEQRMIPFFEKISSLVMPATEEAAQGYFFGGVSVPWSAWIMPLIMHSLLFLAVFLVFMSLSTMVRWHWNDVQRLQYPLVMPVASMIEEGEKGEAFGPFWKDKIVWLGMLIPIIYSGFNGLHRYFPGVPKIGYALDIGDLMPAGPLKSGFKLYPPFILELRYPSMLAIGYLMPTGVSLSMWLFYILYKLWASAQYAMGTSLVGSGMGVHKFRAIEAAQMSGAAFGLTFMYLWLARDKIKDLVSDVFGKSSSRHDMNEPLSSKVTIIGGLLGFAFIVFFYSGLQYASVWWVVYFMLAFFAVSFTLGRLRAEIGLPESTITGKDIYAGVGWYMPTATLGANNIAFIGAHYWDYTYSQLQSIMAICLDAIKLGDSANVNRRKLTAALLVAMVLAGALGMIFTVRTVYQYGGEIMGYLIDRPLSQSKTADSQWDKNNNMFEYALYFLGAGAGATLLLGHLAGRFVWWPLHPVGYFMASYSSMRNFWFLFFLAWALKIGIFRYGGTKLHQKAVPFFVGVLAGGGLMDALWQIVALIVGR